MTSAAHVEPQLLIAVVRGFFCSLWIEPFKINELLKKKKKEKK